MNKRKEKTLISEGIIAALILLVIITFIFMIIRMVMHKPEITNFSEQQLKELNCLSKHYKFQETTIYDYPNNPYITWQGKKVYLRQKGVCQNGKKNI